MGRSCAAGGCDSIVVMTVGHQRAVEEESPENVRVYACMHGCVYASESYSVLSVTNVVNVSKVMWCDVM